MQDNMFNKNKMTQWIEKSLETDKFSIEDQGGSQKGDGFIGEVNFVKVIVNDPKKKEKELYLVVKVAKTDPKTRALSSIMCRTEVIFYTDVFPILDKFQQEKNLKQPFNSIPKCYKAFIEEDTEVVVIENFKPRGYEMLYAIQPLNLNHIKLILKNYAKFHALSFALSDQRKALFKQMEGEIKYSLANHIDGLKIAYDKVEVKSVNYLIEAGQKHLAQKLGKLIEKGFYSVIKNCVDDIPEERVVTHGDCHTQNFLFKYQDGHKENPLSVAFLDFQLSRMHSPMMDLGYFWYLATSKEGFSHFKELMEFYHKELSLSVTELGSDINKTFPISKMWEHWGKYSMYGFIQAVSFMYIFYTEEALEFADILDDSKDDIPVKMSAKNKSEYLDRIVVIADHHFNFKIN